LDREQRLIWELEDDPTEEKLKEARELALTRFTLLIFEVEKLDYLKLSGRPQTRIKFVKGESGTWISQDVNP